MATQTKTRKNAQKGMQEQTLTDLLVMKLQALYYVENQLYKALPVLAKHAADEDLGAAFTKHAEQTKMHIARAEEALQMLGANVKKMSVEAVDGLVDDAEWVMQNVKGEGALDANLIAAAQYAEHYEIAGYASAISWAKMLAQQDVAELLELTLQEEQETTATLTQLADSKINERAAMAADDMGMEEGGG